MLRRAGDITAVAMSPAYQRLHRRLRAAGWPDTSWQNDRLAAAGLLAHVRELDERSLPARRRSQGSGGGTIRRRWTRQGLWLRIADGATGGLSSTIRIVEDSPCLP